MLSRRFYFHVRGTPASSFDSTPPACHLMESNYEVQCQEIMTHGDKCEQFKWMAQFEVQVI